MKSKEPVNKIVLIASDHAGLALKESLQQALPDWSWKDLGPSNPGSVDYPDFAQALAEKVARGEATQGILICGSGIGMSIAANRHAGIRAALVENPMSARLAREHNDANVICLGRRFLAPEYAAEIVKIFARPLFSNDPRHEARVKKTEVTP